ncbi:MAG TPA: hypothetical protein EYO42_03760, partial [Candidatus Poseidoniales archaeon]|nr:hypothetical protein [Candidatus Poseidoniales archaeon]
FHQGYLYESTGRYGNSSLREVELSTGAITRSVALNESLFGEGLALVDSTLIQLTWKNNTALVWNLSDFTLLGNLSYDGEGWGLCNDGEHLIMSNGTDVLTVRNPDNFSIIREIQVINGGSPQSLLNELECDEEYIWANIWGNKSFIRINSTTGYVDQVIDAGSLLEDESVSGTGVLNGIAITDSGEFLLTGKNWPKVFKVNLLPTPGSSPDNGSSDTSSDSNNSSGQAGQSSGTEGETSIINKIISLVLMLVVGTMIITATVLMIRLNRQGQTHKGTRSPMRGGEEDER